MILEEIQKIVSKDKIFTNEPMSKHTSFKIGGPAEIFVKINNVEELKLIIKISKQAEVPITVVGNGSNLLVSDDGIRGIVLKIEFDKIEIEESGKLKVGSGVKLAFLAQKCLKEKLEGFEFASGIPGTIGGAIRMNAGAHGSEMKDIVKKITCMTRDGKIQVISNEEAKFEYRNSIFSQNDYIILEAEIQLKKGESQEIKSKMDEYAKSRKEKQPIEYPSAGSTFKRGKDFITAKLIDEAGLKGYQIGGAQVSEKHAGFIINKGDATATDILNLIEYVKKEIHKKFDKNIELEVQVIGEK